MTQNQLKKALLLEPYPNDIRRKLVKARSAYIELYTALQDARQIAQTAVISNELGRMLKKLSTIEF